MVAATEETVRAVDEGNLHADPFRGAGGELGDEAAQVVVRAIVPAADEADLLLVGAGRDVGVKDTGAEEADGVVIDLVERLALARADDVIIPAIEYC